MKTGGSNKKNVSYSDILDNVLSTIKPANQPGNSTNQKILLHLKIKMFGNQIGVILIFLMMIIMLIQQTYGMIMVKEIV